DNTTFYGEGELSKTITKDENWSSGQTHDKDHTVEEFTDKLGRVVLKRTYDENVPHDTFYVYDDFGNLTYVLSPKTDVSDGVSQTELNDLGYQYVYDRRNRLVEKKLPGKGWEYIVYNMLDQPVLTQDANLRANGDWLFTKYDAIGRVAYTGLHRQQTPLSRVDTQVFGDNTTTYEQYVTRQGTATTLDGTNVYYSNDAIPFGVSKLYTVSYYDDYVDEAGITLPTSVYQQNLRTNVHGLPTVNKVRVLETDDWITTVTGYDTKGRVIFTHSKNPYLETEDITELKLDFTGRILESRTTHKKTGNSDIVIVDNYNYDHMGRNVDHYQTINGSSQELIASNAYNGIGQLQTKSVGNQKTNPLQSMDYEYNVRGWLKSVISSRVNNNIFYEMKLSYNSPPSGSNAQSLFNGNISSFYCGAPGDISTGTSYDYEYDALNRLVSATDTKSYGYFSVPSITYDKNGNIKTLKRNGHLTENPDIGQTVFGLMDDLTYVYVGNSLKNVSEAGHSQHGFRKEEILVNDDYRYDDNGNLTNDTNKGLISAQYNHLNLMTFANIGISTPYEYGSITYVYDASGAKMKKTMNNDAGLSTETEYAGNFIYENDNFQFFGHPEGYATPNGLGGFDYVYQFKDHLGNIRISYADVNDNGQMDYNEGILAENHYYPFGGRQQGKGEVYSSFGNDVAQRWRFGGKEYDESIRFEIYDFGARNYDPWLGRWMNIDPLAEQMRRHSPYNYAFDNPIYFIDPDGMMPGPPDIISRVSNTKRAGKRVQRDVSVTLTLSVVAGENDDLSSTIFSGGSGSVSLSDFEGRADSYFAPADLLANDNVTDFTVEFNVVNSLDDVGENDHVLLLVDEIPQNFGEKSNPVGRAELGGRVSAVERGTLADGSFDEVAQHELGHNTGLPHNDNIRGLMSTNVNGSTSLSSADRGRVVSGNGTGQLAHGDGDGVVKDSERSNRYSTPIKQQALDFLKNNHIQY
ncbi:MAG: RHS repeat-associated core domain-containing protein, partial [Bacteroidota bacterium]